MNPLEHLIPIPTDKSELTRRMRLLFVLLALMVALAHDAFFVDSRSGLGLLVCVIGYSVVYTGLLAYTKQIREPRAFLLLIPALVVASDYALFNNNLIRGFGVIFVVLVLILFSILVTLRNTNHHRFSLRSIPVIRKLYPIIQKWNALYLDIVSWQSVEGKERLRKIILALIIALPILFVFANLFRSADPVFAQLLRDFFHINIDADTVGRIIRTVLFTMLISGLFYVVLDETHSLTFRKHTRIAFDGMIVTIILALVNVLFAGFLAVQMKYLFGDRSFVLDGGMVFAEYARQGFFQLAWVIALAGLLLLVVYRATAEKMNGFLKALKIVLLVQVAVVALSALTRMNLYQQEYGYTVLRLYVEWSIYGALVVIALSIIAVAIRLEYHRVFYGLLLLFVLGFTTVASINVDKMIADKNIARNQQGDPNFDFFYLTQLSIDALPSIAKAFTIKIYSHEGDVWIESVSFPYNYHAGGKFLWEDIHWYEWNRGLSQARALPEVKNARLQTPPVPVQEH